MIQIEMEMPDKCSECRFRTEYEFCSAMPKNYCGTTLDEGKPDWCPLKNADGWISVKDRLPELEGDYLVTDGHYVPWKCRLLILAGAKGWVNGVYNPLIKYWMPMPELPKDGEVDGKDD